MRRSRRRAALVLAVLLVVAVAVVAAIWIGRRDSAADTTAATGDTTGPSASPTTAEPTLVAEPTSNEQVATDSHDRTRSGDIGVVVTYAGWEAPPGVSAMDGQSGQVSVTGFVSGVVESGGACHVTLTGPSGVSVSGEAAGEPDATTTICAVQVQDAALIPGTWQAVLSYESATSSGSARAVPVEVTAR